MAVLDLVRSVIELHSAPSTTPAPYDRLGLVRLCCKHAVSSSSRLADAVVQHAGLSVDSVDSVTSDAAVAAVCSFADHLVDGLFLPLRAVAQCRSVIEPADTSIGSLGNEAASPAHADTDTQTLYIFPPSPMTQIDEDGDQSESGALAASLLSLLSLDDDAVQHLQQCAHTDGNKIVFQPADSSNNWPALFSHFQAVVDTSQSPPTMQRVDNCSVAGSAVIDTATADARLLALHSKIGHILAESGADKYIDSILQGTAVEDMDTAGGTVHLGRLMALRLEGWWNGRQKSAQALWVESSNFVDDYSI